MLKTNPFNLKVSQINMLYINCKAMHKSTATAHLHTIFAHKPISSHVLNLHELPPFPLVEMTAKAYTMCMLLVCLTEVQAVKIYLT